MPYIGVWTLKTAHSTFAGPFLERFAPFLLIKKGQRTAEHSQHGQKLGTFHRPRAEKKWYFDPEQAPRTVKVVHSSYSHESALNPLVPPLELCLYRANNCFTLTL